MILTIPNFKVWSKINKTVLRVTINTGGSSYRKNKWVGD